MKKIINLLAEIEDNGLRVDQFINKYEQSLSRSKIKNLIIKKNLSINDKLSNNPSKKIKINDKISLIIPEPEEINLKPFNYKIDTIYEDNDLIVINKKADISMHPGAGNKDKTLVNALINYNKKLSNINGELRPGIVHRIDKGTSGLVVVAKNNFVHESLSNQFSEHTVDRQYQTLIWGKLRPSKGKIETLITRSFKNRKLMSVSLSKGKKSITNYKTLEIFEKDTIPTFSLVECRLETGRTHQIRVHMSYKGNNIVGDQKYKKKFKKIKNVNKELENKIINLDRQFLHAITLGFTHPINNKRMNFESKLPNDLENILKNLRNA